VNSRMGDRAGVRLIMLLVLVASTSTLAHAVGSQGLMQKPAVAAAIQVLDAWIEATVSDREQPGLSIGIVYDQDLIWAKGYGFADLQQRVPAAPATVYRIGSISKLFTATAIMQLRDAGLLRLDDPVARYLPWFTLKHLFAQGPAITITHLLTHTSGLPRESPLPYWNDLHFPTRDEMIRLLAEQEAVFPAETEWKYSNLGMAIAGEIVSVVSDEPYARYIQRRILTPLGMSSTQVEPEPALPGLAVGYGRRIPGRARQVTGFTDFGALAPAGNLASTVQDLARFASLQLRDGPLGGEQILKGSTLREMQRVHWLRKDWRAGQGLGFVIRRIGEQVRVGLQGAVSGYRAQIEIAPAEKLAVIVLTNADDGDASRYVNQTFAIVGPPLARAMEPPKTVASPDPAWEKYIGAYIWGHSEVQVMLLNNQLTLVDPEAENPWESMVTLKPVGPDTFTMIGGQSNGEPLHFDMDAAGQVTRLTAGNYYRLRK